MTHSPIDKDVDPNLPVLESLYDVLPREPFCLRDLRPSHTTSTALGVGTLRPERLSLVFETENNKVTLLLGEEPGSLGEVVEQPERGDSDEDGDDTLEDEDPSPTLKATDAVHLGDTESKKTAESAGNGGGGEEHGLAKLDLVSAVPHGKVVLA